MVSLHRMFFLGRRPIIAPGHTVGRIKFLKNNISQGSVMTCFGVVIGINLCCKFSAELSVKKY